MYELFAIVLPEVFFFHFSTQQDPFPEGTDFELILIEKNVSIFLLTKD